MSEKQGKQASRREFLKNTAKVTAASALVAGMTPRVHAAEDNTINVVLIGCGGRGSGAAANAMSVKRSPLKLVAMADVFQRRLEGSYNALNTAHADKMDVPKERQFRGFDAYKKAMDCLKPGDIAIFTTPPAFRWVHFTYAIEKGLNVFMEKPVTCDGPTSKVMFELAKKASEKNLKVGVGLMSRHNRGLQELQKRVQDGEIGDIVLQRGYRMSGPGGYFCSPPKPDDISDLMYQIERFHSFIWASGGNFSDFYIHIVDHLSWMKGSLPVKAQALGGRHYRTTPEGEPSIDQNFDNYSVEYTYDDGSKFYFDGRCIVGCERFYSSHLHGTKGSAIASKHGDCGLPSSIHAGQDMTRDTQTWVSEVPGDQRNPYQNEWEDLVDAIVTDTPYNEVPYGVEASLISSMGRMAAHTGQEITYDQMLNCPHEMAPGIDKFTEDSPAPLQPDENGRYPIPMPGLLTDREYDY